VDSMYARMESVSRQLAFLGLTHRSSYDEMLGRLSAGRPTEPLRILADASEARGLGTGRRAKDSLTALNRFVDAARPGSEVVRHPEPLGRRVRASHPADPSDVAPLRAAFSVWAANDAHFEAIAADNAFLTEVKPLSKDLAQVGATGLQILDYLSSGKTP